MKQARLDRIDSELSRIERRSRKYADPWILYGDNPSLPADYDGGMIIKLPESMPRCPEAV